MTPEQEANYNAALERSRREFPHIHRELLEKQRIDRQTFKWNRAFVDGRRILERAGER